MKAGKLKLLTLPLLFCMCGCSDIESGTYFACISSKTSSSISKSYEKFNGTSTYKREFVKSMVLSAVTTTKSGTLILKVVRGENGVDICNETLTEDASYEFYLPKGKYDLCVEGKDHSGSFEFSWVEDTRNNN